MIKSIIKFFLGETTITKKCTCGQQANGICTVSIDVSRTGVMSQRSTDIMRCGEWKKQQKACSRIIENQK